MKLHLCNLSLSQRIVVRDISTVQTMPCNRKNKKRIRKNSLAFRLGQGTIELIQSENEGRCPVADQGVASC